MSRTLMNALIFAGMFAMVGQISCLAQNAQAIVKKAVGNEIAKDQADHSCWIFHEVDRTAKGSLTQWVAQTSAGDVDRVMVKNGDHLSQQQQQHAVDQFVHNPSAQAKQREDNANDDKKATAMLKLLPTAFHWQVVSRNQASTTLRFSPDTAFHPPSREARVFAAMVGTLTLDNAQQRIKEFKGHLVHNVDFGGGLLGELDKGGSFRIERRDLGGGIWDITESHIHIQGRALIFKSISEQQDDVKTLFTREPNSVTLQQGAIAVMKR